MFVVKYRFCYAKYGDAKYVSHLDLIRLFSRSFKRAKLPLTYSEGFNPHPKMAIGLPLSVGVTSECEYLDAELERPLCREDIEELNRKLPLGLHINSAGERVIGMKKLADIRWAEYVVTVTGSGAAQEQLDAFMERDSVIIEKKTKRKTEDTDILPDIASLRVAGEGEEFCLKMMLSAGPAANLKPELVLSAMEKYIDGFRAEDYEVHRLRILADNGKPLL